MEDLSKLHWNSNINKLMSMIFLTHMLLTYILSLWWRYFASIMKGSVGSNTLSYQSGFCNPVLRDSLRLGGLVQTFPMSTCSQGWTYQDLLKTNMLIEQVYKVSIITPEETVPGVILNVWFISPYPSQKHNTVLIQWDNLCGAKFYHLRREMETDISRSFDSDFLNKQLTGIWNELFILPLMPRLRTKANVLLILICNTSLISISISIYFYALWWCGYVFRI